MPDETFDYVDYLDVKKEIDDDSLNAAVWHAMRQWLDARRERRRELRVLEIGAGIGTMIERLLEADAIGNCHYTALELEVDFADAARDRLARWARRHGRDFEIDPTGLWVVTNDTTRTSIDWVTGDALEARRLFPPASFDFLLAHALVDLLPVPRCLPAMLELVEPGGGFYFSLNFSGRTAFRPAEPEDEAVTAAYHGDMDARFPDLDWRPSRTGAELPGLLETCGCRVVAAGASDWRVAAATNAGRRLFIGNILDTIDKAVAGVSGLESWIAKRRRQLEGGELELTVANQDCFGLTAGRG